MLISVAEMSSLLSLVLCQTAKCPIGSNPIRTYLVLNRPIATNGGHILRHDGELIDRLDRDGRENMVCSAIGPGPGRQWGQIAGGEGDSVTK